MLEKNCDKQLAVLLQIQVLTSIRNSAVAQRPFLVFSVGSLSRLLSGCCKQSLFFPSSCPLTSPSYSADHSASHLMSNRGHQVLITLFHHHPTPSPSALPAPFSFLSQKTRDPSCWPRLSLASLPPTLSGSPVAYFTCPLVSHLMLYWLCPLAS